MIATPTHPFLALYCSNTNSSTILRSYLVFNVHHAWMNGQTGGVTRRVTARAAPKITGRTHGAGAAQRGIQTLWYVRRPFLCGPHSIRLQLSGSIIPATAQLLFCSGVAVNLRRLLWQIRTWARRRSGAPLDHMRCIMGSWEKRRIRLELDSGGDEFERTRTGEQNRILPHRSRRSPCPGAIRLNIRIFVTDKHVRWVCALSLAPGSGH